MATDSLTEYQSLLVEYTPRPIGTEREYKRALRHLDKLMRPHLGRAESELVHLISTMVEQYEAARDPAPRIAPAKKLAGLIDARELTLSQVSRETGIPRSTISEIIAGKRKISRTNIAKLAEYFDQPADVFVEWPG